MGRPMAIQGSLWNLEIAAPIVGELGGLIPRVNPTILTSTNVANDPIEEELRLSMHEADDAFLPIPSGVGRFLLSYLEELEPDDRQELEWVWQCLPLSTLDGMRDFLLLQVRWKVQHRELKDRCHCETESMNPKERQCYWVVHDYEISTKDVGDEGYVKPASRESRLVMVKLEPSAEDFKWEKSTQETKEKGKEQEKTRQETTHTHRHCRNFFEH